MCVCDSDIRRSCADLKVAAGRANGWQSFRSEWVHFQGSNFTIFFLSPFLNRDLIVQGKDLLP